MVESDDDRNRKQNRQMKLWTNKMADKKVRERQE